MRFGVSTHVFHAERLDREHLVEIAVRGFDAIELFATRTHFDYHAPRAIEALAEWLADTRLTLHSVHAPIAAGLTAGAWGEPYSTAAADEARRQRALAEADAALAVAATVPYKYLVVHLGVPEAMAPPSGDNLRDAARRSVEVLHERAAAAGIALALEVIPNALSTPEALVRLLEDDLDLSGAGICLDVGHAHLAGDVGEAVEACSGYVLTTHLHDNRKRADDHLVPYEGTIDWDHALLALQKVGYEGAWMFEVAGADDPRAVLDRTARARARFEQALGWTEEMTGD
ncbi:MAG: TIM barrel protein [Acidobacteriota bacterium]